MVHHLEMPFPLARPQIDADETLGKQVVSRTLAAVVVRRRRLDREINEAEIFVDGDLRPHTGVARLGPRTVFPGFIAELARARNGIESPELFSAAHIERAHETFGVVVRGDGGSFSH